MTCALQELVTVVTGAAGGIGRAIAQRFADEGAYVVGLDVNDVAADGFWRSERAHLVVGDAGREADVVRALDSCPNGQVDVVVANAAIQLEKSLLDTSIRDFERLTTVNLCGPFLAIRSAAPRMRAGGSIITMGSVLGYTGDPLLGAYCATKGGVLNLTRAAAVTLGPKGIRVNSICPGAVRTELTTRVWELSGDPVAAEKQMTELYPLRRITTPAEVAALASFLASPESSAITGACIPIDGGLTATNAEYALTGVLAIP